MRDAIADGHARVGRGAVWSIINSGLGQLLSLVVFFVTARFVSPSDFGIMAICLLVVELFRQVAVESFATTITALDSPTDDDFNACFLIILGTSVVSALLALLSAGLIADVLHNERLAFALKFICLLLLTTGLSRTHEAWMTRQMDFRALAIRSILSIVAGGGVGILLAIRGYGLTALIAQQLVTAAVATITLWLASRWKPRLRASAKALRTLWLYGRHVALTGLTNFANTQSDTFFASYYLGAAATGMYNAAKRILLGLNIVLVTALNRVALPAFANLRGDGARMSNAFLRAVSVTSTITAPAFLGLTVVAPDVVRLAMGSQWDEAGAVLSIIALTAYLTSLGQYNQSVLLVHDKPHWQTVLTAIYAVSNIALFLVVVRYGLLALAIGYTARAIILYPLSAGAALHLLELDVGRYVGRIFPSFSAAVVMAIATALFLSIVPLAGPAARLTAGIVFGAVTYGLALLLWGRRELFEILDLSRKIVRGS